MAEPIRVTARVRATTQKVSVKAHEPLQRANVRVGVFVGQVDPQDLEDAIEAYFLANPPVAGYQHNQTTPSASWVIAHPLGRVPAVDVFIGGDQVLADVTVTPTIVTVWFATPQTGTAILT